MSDGPRTAPCPACGLEVEQYWGSGFDSADWRYSTHRAPCGQECFGGGLRFSEGQGVPMRERLDVAHYSEARCPVCNPKPPP